MYLLGAKRRFPSAFAAQQGFDLLRDDRALQRCGQTHANRLLEFALNALNQPFSGYPSFSARLVLVHRRRKANDSPVVNQSWYRDSERAKGPATPTEPAGAPGAGGWACGYYSGMVLRLLRASGGMADALASGASASGRKSPSPTVLTTSRDRHRRNGPPWAWLERPAHAHGLQGNPWYRRDYRRRCPVRSRPQPGGGGAWYPLHGAHRGQRPRLLRHTADHVGGWQDGIDQARGLTGGDIGDAGSGGARKTKPRLAGCLVVTAMIINTKS